MFNCIYSSKYRLFIRKLALNFLFSWVLTQLFVSVLFCYLNLTCKCVQVSTNCKVRHVFIWFCYAMVRITSDYSCLAVLYSEKENILLKLCKHLRSVFSGLQTVFRHHYHY